MLSYISRIGRIGGLLFSADSASRQSSASTQQNRLFAPDENDEFGLHEGVSMLSSQQNTSFGNYNNSSATNSGNKQGKLNNSTKFSYHNSVGSSYTNKPANKSEKSPNKKAVPGSKKSTYGAFY